MMGEYTINTQKKHHLNSQTSKGQTNNMENSADWVVICKDLVVIATNGLVCPCVPV